MRTWILIGVTACTLGALGPPLASPATDDELRRAFDQRFGAWQAHRAAIASSRMEPYFDCPQFQQLIALGPRIAPMLMEKYRAAPGDHFVGWAVQSVSRCQRLREGWSLEQWWERGGPDEAYLAALYAKWKAAKRGEKPVLWTEQVTFLDHDKKIGRPREWTPAGRAWEALRDVGLPIIPFANERFREDDYDLYEIVRELTDNKAPEGPVTGPPGRRWRQEYLAWWEQHKDEWTIPFPKRK
jgi:hypothetical protein